MQDARKRKLTSVMNVINNDGEVMKRFDIWGVRPVWGNNMNNLGKNMFVMSLFYFFVKF